jgi:hypothetical protein
MITTVIRAIPPPNKKGAPGRNENSIPAMILAGRSVTPTMV